MKLLPKQTQALEVLEDEETNVLIFGGAAGGTKSYLGCYWIFKSACKFAESRWVIAREVRSLLMESTYKTFLKVMVAENFPFNLVNYNGSDYTFRFWNGSEVIFKELRYLPGDPEFNRLGSTEYTGCFVDECQEVAERAFNILKSRIRHNLTKYDISGELTENMPVSKRNDAGVAIEWIRSDGKKTKGLLPKMLGTCNPSKGWLYREVYNPHRQGTLESDVKFIAALLEDNPYLPESYRKSLLDLDEASKQRLLYGNWDYDDDPTKLCETIKIYEIWENDFLKTTSFPKDRYLTADIALNGSDLFVVGVWDNFTLIHIETMEKSNGREVEEQLKNLKLKYSVPNSNIIFDSDGIGNFFKGIIKGAVGFTANPSKKALNGESKKYRCLNDQCIFYLCDYVNKNQIHIRQHLQIYKDKISEELGILRNHSYDQDARLSVTPKKIIMENIKRSPDFLDMMKMRMYFELLPKTKGVR